MNIQDKAPRFLPGVMQAIADLKDAQGSTQNKIIEYIQTALTMINTTPKPRNIPVQVKKALQHGVNSGLIKHRSGKYRLALDQKDFTIYKSLKKSESVPARKSMKLAKMRKVKSSLISSTEFSRGRSRRGRRHGRRRRSRRGRRLRKRSQGVYDDYDKHDIQSARSDHSVAMKRSSGAVLQRADSNESLAELKSLDTLSGSYIN